MEKDLGELEEIRFGIYSAEEIRNISVCKVESSKLCTTDKTSGYGTVYDPRMGTIENGVKIYNTFYDYDKEYNILPYSVKAFTIQKTKKINFTF